MGIIHDFANVCLTHTYNSNYDFIRQFIRQPYWYTCFVHIEFGHVCNITHTNFDMYAT